MPKKPTCVFQVGFFLFTALSRHEITIYQGPTTAFHIVLFFSNPCILSGLIPYYARKFFFDGCRQIIFIII